MTTELNPTTHAPVNHDAARRQRELDYIMTQVNQQSASEVPATQAPLAHTVSVDDPPQVQEVASVVSAPTEPTVDWQRETETYKKRLSDAQRALSPAQQKAATLSKELQAERETNAAINKQILDQLAELKEQLARPRQEEAVPVYRPEDDPEFANENPALAERLNLITKSFNARLEQVQKLADSKIAAIEARSAKTTQAVEEERQQLYLQNWDKELRRLIPDVDLFMPGATHGDALVTWSVAVAPEYSHAISNPYAHTPQFVAQVISAFKVSNGITSVNGKRQPLADLANASLMGSSRVVVDPPEAPRLLNDYEFANIKDLVDKAYRDKKPKLGEDLMARYEQTLLQTQKR